MSRSPSPPSWSSNRELLVSSLFESFLPKSLGLLCLGLALVFPILLGRAGLLLGLTHLLAGLGLWGYMRFSHPTEAPDRHRLWGAIVTCLPALAALPALGSAYAPLFTFAILFGLAGLTQRLPVQPPLALSHGLLALTGLVLWLNLAFPAPFRLGVLLVLATLICLWSVLVFSSQHHFGWGPNRARTNPLHVNELFRAVDQNASPVLLISVDGLIEYANHGLLKLTGYELDKVLGQSLDFLLENSEKHAQALLEMTSGRRWKGDLWCRHQSGRLFLFHLNVSPIRSLAGDIERFCCFGEDVTQLREAHKAMERLAFEDSLTGLSNRRHLEDRLDHALKIGLRNGPSLALLFLDLDRFKQINDRYGHDAGDLLLKEVASRLLDLVRAEDTVARLGGDEFVILLENVDTPESVAVVANKILKRITAPILLDQVQVLVSTSIGVALSGQDGNDSERLLKRADQAMYQAKAKGRNRYQFYSAQLESYHPERDPLADDLALALERGQFELYFQPWVDVAHQRIAGAEALLRWNHPRQGQLRPAAFMDLAEKMEMIIPLSHWIFEEIGHYLGNLRTLGLGHVPVSVNLSARQLLDPTIVPVIDAILTKHQLDPASLELEFTEVILTEHTREATQILCQLKGLGVQLVLDDFGSGRFSAGDLAQYQFDRVKVDPHFITQAPGHNADIASAMIAMAHKLNLAVVAEGVETSCQLDRLVLNQCDFAQGYLFYEPLNRKAVTSLLGLGKLPESA